PLDAIAGLIRTGYNSGSWTGTGITSSTAAVVAADALNLNKTGLGFGEASALGISSFDGIDVDATAVLIRYTLLGDANLDGSVDTLDFNLLAVNFSSTGSTWTQGDFDYSGTTDTVDFNLL